MQTSRYRKWIDERIQTAGRWMTPAAAAAGGVLLITVLALFVPPYIGMADNGDYFRILYSNGLYFNAPDYDSQYLGYFVKEYGIFQYFNENGATMTSSQSLIIRFALWINEMFGYHLQFDIRFQAAVYTALYTLGVYLLVEGITWRAPRRQGFIVAALAVFIFGDVGYTAYFNSFYSESLVLIMLLYVTASGLLIWRGRYNDYVLMAVFGASALLLTTSKQQNAPLGVLIAVLGVCLVWVRKSKTHRSLMSLMLLALFTGGVATYVLIPEEFVNINKYHAMTRGVLLESSNPEEALDAFGIDRQYAVLSGTIYYEPYTPIDVNSDQMVTEFYDKYDFISILKYYLTHPDQAAVMLEHAADNAFTNRPAAMGNYERSAGRPFGDQTGFFTGYSWLKEAFAPKTFGFIVLWFCTIVGLYTPSFVAAVKRRRMREATRLPLMAMLMLAGLSSIAVSIIGAGDADLAKHQFLFAAAFDQTVFLVLADALCRRFRLEVQEPVQEVLPETVAVRYRSARV